MAVTIPHCVSNSTEGAYSVLSAGNATNVMAAIYAYLTASPHFQVDDESGSNPGEDKILFSHVSASYDDNYLLVRTSETIALSHCPEGTMILDGSGTTANSLVSRNVWINVSSLSGVGTQMHFSSTEDMFYCQLNNSTNQWQVWLMEVGYTWAWGSNMEGVDLVRRGVFAGTPEITSGFTTNYFLTQGTSPSMIQMTDGSWVQAVSGPLPLAYLWSSTKPGYNPQFISIGAINVGVSSADPQCGYLRYLVEIENSNAAPKTIEPSTSTDQGLVRIGSTTTGTTYGRFWDKTSIPA